MLQWIKKFRNASGQTKFFVFNWVIYGIALVATTVYCYARLDYVRSYKVDTQKVLSNPKP
jgi:hypothetical protein